MRAVILIRIRHREIWGMLSADPLLIGTVYGSIQEFDEQALAWRTRWMGRTEPGSLLRLIPNWTTK